MLPKPCPKCGSRKMGDKGHNPNKGPTHCPFCGRDNCPRDCW